MNIPATPGFACGVKVGKMVGWSIAHLVLWSVLFLIGTMIGITIAGQNAYEEVIVKHLTGHAINNRQVFHVYQHAP